jgi:hypothetical protein
VLEVERLALSLENVSEARMAAVTTENIVLEWKS